MDMGCGPGFFVFDMAQMVGASGRVIAADLQDAMLRKVRAKIRGTELEERVTLHQCGENEIGISERVDFALAFYLVHEVPDQQALFAELATILKPAGTALVVEPPFHVSKKAFEETVSAATQSGLIDLERPRIFPNKAALLGRAAD